MAFGGSGLIRGMAIGGSGLMRGGLIRGMAIGGSGLIRGMAFGGSGLWWEWPYKRRITVVKTPIYPTDFYESTLVANPKIYNFFDLLKSLYSDTKILSKYIPSLQRRW